MGLFCVDIRTSTELCQGAQSTLKHKRTNSQETFLQWKFRETLLYSDCTPLNGSFDTICKRDDDDGEDDERPYDERRQQIYRARCFLACCVCVCVCVRVFECELHALRPRLHIPAIVPVMPLFLLPSTALFPRLYDELFDDDEPVLSIVQSEHHGPPAKKSRKEQSSSHAVRKGTKRHVDEVRDKSASPPPLFLLPFHIGGFTF
ncbi:unnamed protein product [Strongylus vulgaris]|uniref:Uncharacterized protein n=1 Tax=Strongylus vulgaris TaxID=40348 RepID=A0A3P7IYN7_STRVU|nr:unnamed protein product [Strongylus vulgaris]